MPTIRIHPLIGLAAVNSKCAGAWRIWALARSLDGDGLGAVARDDVLAALRGLGVNDQNIWRWLREGQKMGLFRDKVSKRGIRLLFLTGIFQVCKTLGVVRVGARVEIDAALLFAKGWKRNLWSAYIATTNERPISQRTKHDLTGFSPRTQRNLQRRNGTAIKNFAETNYKPDDLPGLREFSPYTYFKAKDNKIYQRLPDSRIAPNIVIPARRGRTRKIQSALNRSLSMQRAGGVRMFCEDEKSAKKQLRKLAKDSARKYPKIANPPETIFERVADCGSYRIWRGK